MLVGQSAGRSEARKTTLPAYPFQASSRSWSWSGVSCGSRCCFQSSRISSAGQGADGVPPLKTGVSILPCSARGGGDAFESVGEAR
eukprot:9489265-Pyramimonas_sp.AAC.1